MENALDHYKIVPIVQPMSNDPNTSGRVLNLHCGGGVCHPHVMRTRAGWELNPGFARRGFKLLRDAYLEEQDAAGWARYEKYVAAWQSGQTRSSFPPHWLPKSVQEAQRCMLSDEFADAFKSPPTTGAARPEPAKATAEEVKPEVQSEQPALLEQAAGRKGVRS